MFSSARLRLTAWYMAILTAIVGLLSSLLYRILVQLHQTEMHAAVIPRRYGVARLFAHDELSLAYQIIAIDAGVLILAAIGAYVLAGRTLTPIQEVMERQQRFASAVSHELRTPLTVMQGTMEVALLNRRSPDEYVEVLRDASLEAARMGAMITDLMALARAESDVAVLTLGTIDLGEIVCDAVAGLRPLAERKQQALEVEIEGILSLRGDAIKLRQVLANLLDNAIAYTPQGGMIRVVGRRERGHITVEVRDTGQGIAPEHIPHLFEPFYRVDTARGGGDGHVGLGLAMAGWIVRAHAGHIGVQSHLGVGTVFTVELPTAAHR